MRREFSSFSSDLPAYDPYLQSYANAWLIRLGTVSRAQGDMDSVAQRLWGDGCRTVGLFAFHGAG